MLPINEPVEVYMFGDDWQIRDKKTRKPIIRVIVMSRDLNYQRYMKDVIEYVGGLINDAIKPEVAEAAVEEVKPEPKPKKRVKRSK